jgi:HK97 family phage major capsid protein
MKNNDTTVLTVCKEDGWSYNGIPYALEEDFRIDTSDLPHMQKFIDEKIVEVKVATTAVTAKRAGELYGQGVKDSLGPVLDGFKEINKSLAGLKVHHKYNDDPDFRNNGGYPTFTSFLSDVRKNEIGVQPSEKWTKWLTSDEVKVATSMGEAIQSDGGVLAPTAFRNSILSNAVEESIVFPRATFIPTPNGSVEIPAVEVSSHSTSLFGGVIAYWSDEGTAPTATKPKFGKVELKLNALKAIAHVTDELLEDSIISLEQMLPAQFSTALSFQMDEAFLTGTGAGKPQGVTKSPALVTVAKETGQAADTIVTENILNMFSRMYSPSRSKAVWIANQNTFPQLASLSLAVGTGGSTVGILQQQTLQGTPGMSLLGNPIIFTEKAATVGDANDIMFCDFSQYLIGGKSASGQSMQSSIHLKFDQFETSFRISQRMDGRGWWKTALTPRNGSTLSPFVGLAVRA